MDISYLYVDIVYPIFNAFVFICSGIIFYFFGLVLFMKKHKIDYYLVAFAEDYYRRRGFNLIDVPWLVSEAVSNLTKPNWKRNFWVKKKVLVGSAEQSFIELFFDGKIKEGRYLATTPCFRDEQKVGWLHQNYFLKTELIEIGVVGEKELEELITTTKGFFSLFLKTKVVKTGLNSFDIVDVISGVELGSYGLSSLDNDGTSMSYVYGTGCALPRLSTVIASQKRKGYHEDFNIPKSVFGSFEKVLEEVWEIRDAVYQDNNLLICCEMADLIGAIDEYSSSNFGLGIEDLRKMAQLTKRAFEAGSR